MTLPEGRSDCGQDTGPAAANAVDASTRCQSAEAHAPHVDPESTLGESVALPAETTATVGTVSGSATTLSATAAVQQQTQTVAHPAASAAPSGNTRGGRTDAIATFSGHSSTAVPNAQEEEHSQSRTGDTKLSLRTHVRFVRSVNRGIYAAHVVLTVLAFALLISFLAVHVELKRMRDVPVFKGDNRSQSEIEYYAWNLGHPVFLTVHVPAHIEEKLFLQPGVKSPKTTDADSSDYSSRQNTLPEAFIANSPELSARIEDNFASVSEEIDHAIPEVYFAGTDGEIRLKACYWDDLIMSVFLLYMSRAFCLFFVAWLCLTCLRAHELKRYGSTLCRRLAVYLVYVVFGAWVNWRSPQALYEMAAFSVVFMPYACVALKALQNLAGRTARRWLPVCYRPDGPGPHAVVCTV